MAKKLFIGNLPWDTTEADLKDMFADYGDIGKIILVRDERSRRFKGYAFIEMDPDGAEKAKNSLDGTALGGRKMRVEFARGGETADKESAPEDNKPEPEAAKPAEDEGDDIDPEIWGYTNESQAEDEREDWEPWDGKDEGEEGKEAEKE